MNNPFDLEKWSKIDLEKWQKEQYELNKDNNPVLECVNFNDEYYNTYPKTGLLEGVPFAIKDNLVLTRTETTGGTGVMEGFVANFTSTVVRRLMKQGAIPLYKTNLDELAMGGTGLLSKYGEVRNYHDNDRIVGGSSSGSVYAVSAKMVPFAIGSDTGDSIRMPAAYAGAVGFKPTWGLISRIGIYDFAPTWDTIGFLTENVSEQAMLLDITACHDPRDASSTETSQKDFLRNINTDKKIKFGYWKHIIDHSQPEIVERWNVLIDNLKKSGHEVIELDVDYKLVSTILPVYRTISSIEAFSTNANLTGFLFGVGFNDIKGTYEEKIRHARTEGFGYEVKKRFLFAQEGILNSNEIYNQARKLRTLISKEIDRQLDLVDALLNPAAPNVAHKAEKFYDGDILANSYLGIFNATGSPSLTVPCFKGRLPVGFNISTKPFHDLECLQISKIVEDNIE